MLSLSEDPGVAMLFDSFQTPTHLYMVMEFLPGGALMSLLVKLDTRGAASTHGWLAPPPRRASRASRSSTRAERGGYSSARVEGQPFLDARVEK